MPEKGKAKQERSTPPAPCEVLFACTICRASFKDVPQLFTHYSTSHTEETSSKCGRSQCKTEKGDATAEPLQSARGKRKVGEQELSSTQAIDGSSPSGKEVRDGSAKKLQRFSGGDDKICDTQIPASGSNDSSISVTKDCVGSGNEKESKSSKNIGSYDAVGDVSGKRKHLLSEEEAAGVEGSDGDEGASSSCDPGSKDEGDCRKRQKILGRDGAGRDAQGLSNLVAGREEVMEATRKRSLSPMTERNVVRNEEYEQGRNCDKRLKTTEDTPDNPVQCRESPPELSGGSTEEDAGTCGGGTEQELELDMVERADEAQAMDLNGCFPHQVGQRSSRQLGDSASEDFAMQVSDAVADVLAPEKVKKMDGIFETSTEKEDAYLSRRGNSECERDCHMEDLPGCGRANAEMCGGDDEESMAGTDETAVKEMGPHVVKEKIKKNEIDRDCDITDECSQCPGNGGQEESATNKKIESSVEMCATEMREGSQEVTEQETSDSYCVIAPSPGGELHHGTCSSEWQNDPKLYSAALDSDNVTVSGCEDNVNETKEIDTHRCSDKANSFLIVQAPCRTGERQTESTIEGKAQHEEVVTGRVTGSVVLDNGGGKLMSDTEKELTSGSQGCSSTTVDKLTEEEENTMTKSCAGVVDTSSGSTGMGDMEAKEGNSRSCCDGNETERRESVGQESSDSRQNTEGDTEREVVSLAGNSDIDSLLHSKEENAGIDCTNIATYVNHVVSTNICKKQNTGDTCSESEVTLSGDKRVDGALPGRECTLDNCVHGIEANWEQESECGAVRRKYICLQGESLTPAAERERKASSCEGGSNGNSLGTFASEEAGLIESKEEESSKTDPSDSRNDAAEKLSSSDVTVSRNRTEHSSKSSCEPDTLHSDEVESSPARGVGTTGTCKSSKDCDNSDGDMARGCPVNKNDTSGTTGDVVATTTSVSKPSGKNDGEPSKKCSADAPVTSGAAGDVVAMTTSVGLSCEVTGKRDGEPSQECSADGQATSGAIGDVVAATTLVSKPSEVNGKNDGQSSKKCSADVQNTSVAGDEVVVTTTSATKASEVKGKEDGEQLKECSADTPETLGAAGNVTGTTATADKSCGTEPWREEDHCTVTVKKNVPLGMLKGRANSLMVLFQHANKSQPLPEGSTFKLSSTSGEMDYTVVANVDVEIREYGKLPLKP